MNGVAIRLLAVAFPLALLAAEPPVAPAPQPESPLESLLSGEAPPAPPSIPLPTLARSLESGLSRIRFLEALAHPSPTAERIRRDLPETGDATAELSAWLVSAVPNRVSFREIGRQRVRGMELQTTLTGWEATLERDAKALDDAGAELASLEETWTATISPAHGGGTPAVLVEKIDSLLLQTAALREKLRTRAETLLLLQDDVSTARVRIQEAIHRLDKLSVEVRDQLFAIENDPIWTALGSGAGVTLGFEVAELWRAAVADVVHDLSRNSGRFMFQIAMFIALALAGSFLVRRARADTLADSEAKAAAELLDRPVAAALILSLFAGFWLYPATATPVHGATLLFLLIPYFRFLSKLAPPALKGPAHALGAVFFIDRVHDFVPAPSMLSRLILLATGLGAIACWAWAYRSIVHSGARVTRMRWRIFVRVAILLLVSALVANVVGNVSLAEQLTVIAVKGAFAGGLLSIIARILESFYVLLLSYLSSLGAPMVVRHRALLQRRGQFTIRLLAMGTWVVFLLWITRVIVQSGNVLLALLSKKWTIGELNIGLGAIGAFLLALTIGVVLARLISFVLDEAILPRMSLPRGVPAAISTSVKYVVTTFGLVMAFLAAGLEMKQFAFLAGAFGLGIGFGLQNIVNNFVSGLILLYERPIQIGDVLEVGTLRGHVRRIGIRSSTLSTFDGAEVIVPNASLISSNVVNWTFSNRARRVDIAVGVGYGSDPAEVLATLLRVAKAHAEVLRSPEPAALFFGFGESGLDFQLRVWAPEYDTSVRVGSEIRTAIFAAFKEAGIEIPFPQRDLHVKTVSEAAGRVLSGTEEAPPKQPV